MKSSSARRRGAGAAVAVAAAEALLLLKNGPAWPELTAAEQDKVTSPDVAPSGC